jgi:hypothetical protein
MAVPDLFCLISRPESREAGRPKLTTGLVCPVTSSRYRVTTTVVTRDASRSTPDASRTK